MYDTIVTAAGYSYHQSTLNRVKQEGTKRQKEVSKETETFLSLHCTEPPDCNSARPGINETNIFILLITEYQNNQKLFFLPPI